MHQQSVKLWMIILLISSALIIDRPEFAQGKLYSSRTGSLACSS